MTASIAVVGSYGAGLTFSLERLPTAGETVIGASFRVDSGGKGSNQAIGAARLGANVSFLTAVGEDAFGTEASSLWAREGLEAKVRTIAGAATMVGGIFVEPSGENRIVIAPGALAALTPADVAAFESQIAAADACLVGLEIPAQTALEALRVARRYGVRTILNPAPVPEGTELDELLGLSDYLTPNFSEACALTGVECSPSELASRLRAKSGATVVLTLGAEGALYFGDAGRIVVPALKVERVLDTTGAGDAFNAAFAVALAEGEGELEAVRRGCAAGAWMVGFAGVLAGLASRTELENWTATSTMEAIS